MQESLNAVQKEYDPDEMLRLIDEVCKNSTELSRLFLRTKEIDQEATEVLLDRLDYLKQWSNAMEKAVNRKKSAS